MTTTQQSPSGDGIVLDHLAHWVPDMASAASELEHLGFTLTPYTEHTHSPAPNAPLEPAGSANHCIMLREGYLEVLTATADTAIAHEVRTAIARHIGVHLVAFGVNDAPSERERLVAQGFAQRPTVALKRLTTLADGSEQSLRFTVIRPEPGLLPEGRVQFLTHHTAELLWEERWLGHANGAQALSDVLLCTKNVDECAQRYARYLRTDAAPLEIDEHGVTGRILRFERGALSILDSNAASELMHGIRLCPAPCIAAYAVRVRDIAATRQYFTDAGVTFVTSGQGSLLLPLPSALGGVCVFHDGSGPVWRH